ncbi:MAG: bifunctional folylpolyglutamate synthase/dihydrofolate synthase [Bryobacterales bacterium]|nr:bifunctional folylpolyglutamate synthase/dihydrofolate synthase [Bryobacterales bacterium]
MTGYPDSVRYLYALGNEIKAGKFDLRSIAAVLERLGHPERAARIVHVAGTNGKGSTCTMMASALQRAGYRTGLYTSPHLVSPTERIRIDGVAVSEEEFAAAFDVVHRVAEEMLASGELELHPTYFETVTAMAFVIFRERGVQWTVLEVGLGGRLDATNVVTPELAVITPIDYDHEAWLGHTIAAIAGEKAGIIKAGVPVVLARQRPEAEQVIRERAQAVGAPLVRADDYPPSHVRLHERGSTFEWDGFAVECPLAGAHQVDNTVTALTALRQLGIPQEAVQEGIRAARWPGRLEYVSETPAIVLDGAHNPAGVRALAAYIREWAGTRKVWLIYATMRDKSVGEIADVLFPLVHELILTAADNPRALHPETLLQHVDHPKARTAPNLAEALEMVRREAASQDLIFISGSLYLVGEARALLVK